MRQSQANHHGIQEMPMFMEILLNTETIYCSQAACQMTFASALRHRDLLTLLSDPEDGNHEVLLFRLSEWPFLPSRKSTYHTSLLVPHRAIHGPL